MYAPHPPTRITDLLNPVRPPDRVLPSPSSSSASFSEEGRERVHIDRSNHQLDSPRAQSNTVHNNFIKQHSSNPPSPVSERQRHFNNYDRDNSPASCKPHIHSPTTPHAHTHALPQQTHQRAYSLRAASWDTATTNGGEVDPRSGRGRPNDDGDDRQSSSSPAVSTSWQRTQPSVRLPSIDHEGSLYHTGASTGWSGYTHPHPPHPHSLPHAPLSHGSPLYRHVLPVPMPHPVAGTHHPNVGVGAANHGPSATQTVPAVSTERHPPFMYNQQPYQQQHVPRRAEEPVLGGDSRSDGAQAQGRRGDESSEAMAMDDESFQSSERASTRLVARASRDTQSGQGPSSSRTMISTPTPGPIHPPPYAHVHPHPHVPLAGHHTAGAYVVPVPVPIQGAGVGMQVPVPLVPLSLPSHPIAYAQPTSHHYLQATTSSQHSQGTCGAASIQANSPPFSVHQGTREKPTTGKRKRGETPEDDSQTASGASAAGAPEDVDQEAPKTKKTKSKNNTATDGNAGKRGNPCKKRNEPVPSGSGDPGSSTASAVTRPGKARPSDVNRQDGPVMFVPPGIRYDQTNSAASMQRGMVRPELQFARCMSNRYKADTFPRCVSCTRRWAGDTCRFQGIRLLLKDESKNTVAVSFVESGSTGAPVMKLPERWNVELDRLHLERTMKTVAKAFLPHLREEQKHLQQTGLIRRPRETDVRATCDTCMTSLFSSSWMCRQCGREACSACFATVRALTDHLPLGLLNPKQRAELNARRDRHAQRNPFFLSCNRRNEHGVLTFSPVTRFAPGELEAAVAAMEKILPKEETLAATAKLEGSPSSSVGPAELVVEASRTSPEATSSRATIKPGTNEFSGPVFSPTSPRPWLAEGAKAIVTDPRPPSYQPSPDDPPLTPTWPIPYFEDSALSEDKFSRLWTMGAPLVVTDLLKKFRLQWTPEYFMNTYGQQNCIILNCQHDANKRVTVGEFFSWFGNFEDRSDVWKLKDWPPSTDFKTTFPELYDDFCHAVPVPNYTRRDGVLNIASHFPSNTISPDLGPKMYNALASTEDPGSKGSTCLHMDMADAVNIMLYASKTPSGEEGSAVWDIYRAEDASKIRQFLRKHFKGSFQNDPIHAQTFYLDRELRKKLYDEFGVKGWRIYQKPGEAIFIPAGCAHQVCNLADCIKVACDFVSPENIERCEALTKEFRDQNHAVVWKEDVLQLRSMMWFAWLSCSAQMKARYPEAEPEVVVTPLPGSGSDRDVTMLDESEGEKTMTDGATVRGASPDGKVVAEDATPGSTPMSNPAVGGGGVESGRYCVGGGGDEDKVLVNGNGNGIARMHSPNGRRKQEDGIGG